jgi:DNA mismatch repair protein MutL
MSDIIHLLPDSVANQIAAGEVIQRPASAVKELLENAIDAGATQIKLVLKEAGKTLIQVIDNGKGMSETDARMCFERHATSKLRKAEDLFEIRTMGFRGEAMASIAAIAQVELKTKQADSNVGTLIEIEASELKKIEACSTADGTQVTVKNLFYNIPARRNFLKSNPVELRHIIDEFQRQALAHPEIFFSLHNDGTEMFHLPVGNLKQRITAIFGNNYTERIVPVEESTDIIQIIGYVGKPQFAKKTRGEQYFFVNKRFIKDPYLNHAVSNAFDELLNSDSYPLYVLFIDIDPKHIDVNVHPTKTEIKFDDEKLVYAIMRSAIKRSLGRYHVSPTIDFNTESSFSNLKPFDPRNDEIRIPTISVNPEFNPFEKERKASSWSNGINSVPRSAVGWEALYEIAKPDQEVQQLHLHKDEIEQTANDIKERSTFQIHQRYIVSPIKNGILLIDQQAAHERILYERFLEMLNNQAGAIQQCLFPQSVNMNAADYELTKMLLPDLKTLGFDVQEFGKNTFVIHGIPAEINSTNEEQLLLGLLETYKQQSAIYKFEQKEQLARSMAKQSAIKHGNSLSSDEMNHLIDELFACELPQAALNTKSTFVRLNLEDLASYFIK